MIRRLLIAALLSVSTAAVAAPKKDIPITLSDSPYDQARSIINVMFADYIRGLTGVVVQSAIIDLDGDRTGEIVARFVHSSSCREGNKQCRTVVVRHDTAGWKIVLDRFADNVVMKPGFRDVPAPLTLDSKEWEWEKGGYRPIIGSFGTKIELEGVNKDSSVSYSKAFGAAEKLMKAGAQLRFDYAQKQLSPANDVILVKMDGESVCGMISGCPVRVLTKDGDNWKPSLKTFTMGDVYVTKTVRAGHSDFLLETKDGFVQYGWTGTTYAVADRVERISK